MYTVSVHYTSCNACIILVCCSHGCMCACLTSASLLFHCFLSSSSSSSPPRCDRFKCDYCTYFTASSPPPPPLFLSSSPPPPLLLQEVIGLSVTIVLLLLLLLTVSVLLVVATAVARIRTVKLRVCEGTVSQIM